MKRLFTRLFLSFMMLITITLTAAALLSARQVRKAAWELMDDLMRQTVSARADQIDFWLGQRMSELRVMSESGAFQGSGDGGKIEIIEDFAVRHADDFESVGLVKEDGTVFVSGGDVINISERGYYRKMRASGRAQIISQPLVSRSDRSSIAVILLSAGDSLISGAILLSYISDIAAKIEVKGQHAFIIDRAGYIVAHSDRNRLLSKVNAADIQNDFFRISRPIDSADGWFLVVDIPKKVLKTETSAMIKYIATISAVMAAFGLLTAMLLAASLTRPVKNLQSLMFQAERGNLDVRAPAVRQDELGRLEQSFNSMIIQMKNLIDELGIKKLEVREKHLASMLNQIKPHFLYNSLDSVRWLAIENDDPEVADMIEALSKLFRVSLSGGAEMIPLSRELVHAESYLKIQRSRYGKCFRYEIITDGGLESVSVIKLIIQPLVENAINHGVLKNAGGEGLIRIRCSIEDGDLLIRVCDDGPGFVRPRPGGGERSGYAMGNVDERLSMHFGADYGISRISEPGRDTEVIIRHPVIRGADREGADDDSNC